jgi:sulfate adenylyltransferase
MRMGGPREAMLHAIVRSNYGCSGFIIGRDHAGPSYKTKDGKSFYGEYDAQNFVLAHKDEIGIDIYPSSNIFYIQELDEYLDEEEFKNLSKSRPSLTILNLSGTELRNKIRSGIQLPSWFTYPEIYHLLSISEMKKGICFYFIGLSGSGKSTLARALEARLKDMTDRKITILDGDIVRRNLSKGLGFSKEDRSDNVRRIGYVASEIVKHGGICIVANIAPYEQDRMYNRRLIEEQGKYFEIYVNTSLETCIKRDVKGIYQRFHEGTLKNVRGIDDLFEFPQKSDLIIESEGDINLVIDKVLEKTNL